MKYYIFRNQTIEPFFGNKDVAYSGYGDIGNIPEAETYLWFYQVPPGNTSIIVDEVSSYFNQLQLVKTQLPKSRVLVIFSLSSYANTSPIESDFSLKLAIDEFNVKAMKLAQENAMIKYIDFDDFIKHYTATEYINWKFYFISQMVLNPKLVNDFSHWWKQKEISLALQRKKCLVLDLDNTLWGGILGEDGPAGIKIGGDYPGKAFSYWQSSLLALSKTGIMLAVCSKNNEADVLEAWDKNPNMILKREHFVDYRINWQDKATNLRDMATTLNIGLDSMVFVDDNPAERELIKQTLPEVAVPVFPDKPYELMAFYDNLVKEYFRVYSTTEEDLSKTEQYKANAQRAIRQAQFVDFDGYLRSLDIHMSINTLDEFNLPRIAQMTQKTNQFNLTTIRRTEADIKQLQQNGALIYCLSVSDVFGDNGITGEIILQPIENDIMTIDTFLLSCRILGKGIELAFLHTILNHLHHNGVTKVKAKYERTLKNGQVADFYDRAGFTLLSDSETSRFYEIKLDTTIEISNIYTISLK